MFHFAKKSLLANLLLAGIAMMVLYSSFFVVRDMMALRAERRALEQKKEELETKRGQLEQYLAELDTKEAIEREAKGRFNLKNPGEHVVIVMPESGEAIASSTARPGLWERLLNLFSR